MAVQSNRRWYCGWGQVIVQLKGLAVRPSSHRRRSLTLTLHACGSEALASEEYGVVVVLGMLRIVLLLHVGPAAHVLQAA